MPLSHPAETSLSGMGTFFSVGFSASSFSDPMVSVEVNETLMYLKFGKNFAILIFEIIIQHKYPFF